LRSKSFVKIVATALDLSNLHKVHLRKRKSDEEYRRLYLQAQKLLASNHTKSEVARTLGVPRSTITRWSRGSFRQKKLGRKAQLSDSDFLKIGAYLKSDQADVYDDATLATYIKEACHLKRTPDRSTVAKWRKRFGWNYDEGRTNRILAKDADAEIKRQRMRRKPSGHSIDSKVPSAGQVLMAMGAKGFNFDQAKRYAAAKKLKVKNKSIHTYLSMGRTGKRGKPAKLTAEQWAEVKKLAGPKTPWPKTVKSTIY